MIGGATTSSEAPRSDSPDEVLLRLVKQREKEEAVAARQAARELSATSRCPVCSDTRGEKAAVVTSQPVPAYLRWLVRRPPLECEGCGLKAVVQPNSLAWALAMIAALGCALSGMSAIFTAQRLTETAPRNFAFLAGAALFLGGMWVGSRAQAACGSSILGQAILRLRRRERGKKGKKSPKTKESEGSGWANENLEAVVVAIILALIIRHFTMEAFVIPTGSMAPTLLGDHFRVECSDCGYPFPLSKKDTERVSPRYPVFADCPLCGEGFTTKQDPGDVYGGDKILVNKLSYVLGEPSRFDVVVFKFPEKPYQNFIKRLIGLPGESIEIKNGDVFVNGELARKPDQVQDATWIPVYDSSYVPRKVIKGAAWAPWDSEGAAWDLSDEQRLRAEPSDGGDAGWIHYDRLEIDDRYGYARGLRSELVAVPDLRVRAVVQAEAGATVRLAVVDDGRVVAARFSVGEEIELALELNGQPVQQARAPGLSAGKPVEIGLAYSDDRARLLIDGETGLEWLDEAAPRAGSRTRNAGVRLQAEGARLELSELRIDRDVHYVPSRDGRFDPSDGPLRVPDDSYFCMGDHSSNSQDGRAWGFVNQGHMVGRAFLVFWPVVPFQLKLIR